MSATIEWRASNLVALGEELRSKIARVTTQFEERAATARDPNEANRLRQRLSQLVQSIQASYRLHLERMTEDEAGRDETLYDASLAGIDMNLLVYRGDRRALAELLAARRRTSGTRSTAPSRTCGRRRAKLSRDVTAMMNGVQKLQLVRDLVSVSYADGHVDPHEVNCLAWLCQNLGVDPRVIEQVLVSARRGVD